MCWLYTLIHKTYKIRVVVVFYVKQRTVIVDSDIVNVANKIVGTNKRY